MSESTEQQATVSWCRLQYPKHRIIAIPNGQWVALKGYRKFKLIEKYKAEGLTNGVSDLLLCVARKGYHGLWIEMKDKGKTASSLSPEQIYWQSDMRDAGYKAECCFGFEQAKKIIEEYLS